MGFLTMVYYDFDGDSTQTSIKTSNVEDEASYAAWRSKLLVLSTAMNTISAGYQSIERHVNEENDFGPNSASSAEAQKKLSLILVCQDTVLNRTFIERIPMPKNVTLTADAGPPVVPAWIVTGTGKNKVTTLNASHSAYTALKAAYDDVGRSPNGNPSTLQTAYIEE